jgi:hypothetical protein
MVHTLFTTCVFAAADESPHAVVGRTCHYTGIAVKKFAMSDVCHAPDRCHVPRGISGGWRLLGAADA